MPIVRFVAAFWEELLGCRIPLVLPERLVAGVVQVALSAECRLTLGHEAASSFVSIWSHFW
jgi:hypothetical protein